jgi:hypothetical protein
MSYRFLYPTGDAATLTPAQHTAMVKVADRWQMGSPVEVSPMLGGDGAVMVNVGSMWLGVEPDGYTHS